MKPRGIMMAADMTTPDKILQRALEKEMQARDFYRDLARQTKVEFVKELLETLQSEEAKHVHMIEKLLGKLAAGQDLV
jgi:rubrerythrin